MYRRLSKHGSGDATVSALLEIHAVLEPSVRHVIEQKQEITERRDTAGEPPKPVDQA